MSGCELFFDTEGTGLNMISGADRATDISYAMGDGPVKYVDLRTDSPEEFIKMVDDAEVIVAHGTKFDAHSLRTIGIDISNKNLDCTLVRAQLIDEHKLTYDLDSLTGMKVNIIDDLAAMFGGRATKNVQMPNLHKAPRDFKEKYAVGDVLAMRSLYRQQEGKLPPVHALEKEVLNVLIKMEQKGIRVDGDRLDKAKRDVQRLIDRTQKELDKMAGKEVNVNSTPQMRDLLIATEVQDGRVVPKTKAGKCVLIDGTLADKTKTGGVSLNAETLEEMSHPIAEAILKVRKYRKIHDTFIVSQLMGHQTRGRVHPNFNQTRVVTGRLSCNNPNLQAVPKRDPEMKAILRPLFLPDDGAQLLKCDYDQSDVRGFAHYIYSVTNDKNHPILQAYQKDPDTDFHTFVSELLGIRRNPGPGGGANAKQINLAMIFNMGMGKLAKQMGLPYEEEIGRNKKVYLKPGQEAIDVFNMYHSKIPGAADMAQMASSIAASRGYVTSICGRHLRFPDKRFTYKASGYLYQSFTADLIKKAMVETAKIVVPQLSVHDELLFSIYDKETAFAIQKVMQEVFANLTVIPIRTKPEVGRSWGEVNFI